VTVYRDGSGSVRLSAPEDIAGTNRTTVENQLKMAMATTNTIAAMIGFCPSGSSIQSVV
jgi:hypothetical protein